MKWYTFKFWTLFFICLCMVNVTTGQTKHDDKIEKYKSGWASLLPRNTKFQFAGGMGLFSLGVGWDYGKKKQWETDLLFGFLPKFSGEHGHATITFKQNYYPWKISVKENRWMLEPFSVSLYLNKIFGDEFWRKEPDKYPNNYYNIVTNLRFNLAFGQRINFNFQPVLFSKQLSFYYEVSTNDLYVVSYFTNKYLKITDIFSLSLGVKFQFL